jgi:peptide/nickel transport system substrate-binding protein
MNKPSHLMKYFVLLASASILASCSGGATPAAPATQPPAEKPAATAASTEATKAPDAKPAGKYQEAPMWADMVKSGKLPPVDQRLPSEPFVVGPGVLQSEKNVPDWKPGKYGGTLHTAHAVANWSPDVFVMLNEPVLKAPDLSVQGVKGNVVQDFKVSSDNKEFTFTMRKGLKWSDGEPVTTEDVRFTWEDIYGNDKLYSTGLPSRFKVGYSVDGTPGKLQIVDDFTFKVTFDAAYGGFVRNLTIEGWNGYTELINPSHYLKKYHIKYTSLDKMKDDLTAAKLTNEWWNLFNLKRCQNWDMTNPKCVDYPALNPWIGTKADQGLLKFKRNPYFYMVDTEGKQLPYIDEIISVQAADVEMVNVKVVSGDVDYLRESTALIKVPMYKEAEDKAKINTILLDMHVDSSGLYLNQIFSDTNWQKASSDIRFRQALSHAINRKELIDTLYYGYASMPDVSVGPQNYNYDVAAASKLLDDMGLKKGSDGMRTYADGKPVLMLIEHAAWAPDIGPAAELAAQYLNAVGIKTSVKKLEGNAFNQKGDANEIQASIGWSHDQGWDNGYTSVPGWGTNLWWDTWINSKGKQGVEPPAWVKQGVELNKKRWESVSGSDEYNKLKEEGYKWSRDNLPFINFVEQVKYPMIAKKNLRNMASAGFAIGNNFQGVQLWFDQ